MIGLVLGKWRLPVPCSVYGTLPCHMCFRMSHSILCKAQDQIEVGKAWAGVNHRIRMWTAIQAKCQQMLACRRAPIMNHALWWPHSLSSISRSHSLVCSLTSSMLSTMLEDKRLFLLHVSVAQRPSSPLLSMCLSCCVHYWGNRHFKIWSFEHQPTSKLNWIKESFKKFWQSNSESWLARHPFPCVTLKVSGVDTPQLQYGWRLLLKVHAAQQ